MIVKMSFVIRLALCFFIAPIIAMANPVEAPLVPKKNYDISMDSFLQRYFASNKPGAAILVMKRRGAFKSCVWVG